MNREDAKYFLPERYCTQLKLTHKAVACKGLNAGRHECTNYDQVLDNIPNFVKLKPDIYLKIYTSVKAQANYLVEQSWSGRLQSEEEQLEEKFERDFLIPIIENFLKDIRLSKNKNYPEFVNYKLTSATWKLYSNRH